MKKLVLTGLFLTASIVAMEQESDVQKEPKKELPTAQKIALLEAYMNMSVGLTLASTCRMQVFFRPFSTESTKTEENDHLIRMKDAKDALNEAHNYVFTKLMFANGKVASYMINKEELLINEKLKANKNDEAAQLSESMIRLCK